MKIFIDTDVILDFLLDRKPFSDQIGQLFQLSIDTDLQLCISPTTVTNINYIIGRIENKKQANLKTKKILKLVSVENVCQSTVNKAIQSKFKDFEDGVQNFCAIEANHKIIITRNTRDYKESELAIFTPTEYLAKTKI